MLFRQGWRRVVVRTTAKGVLGFALLEWTTELPSQGRSSIFYHRLVDEGVTPLLRLLPPEMAHQIGVEILSANDTISVSPTFRLSSAEQQCQMSQTLFQRKDGSSLTFGNPIGLAAGFDKNGVVIEPMLQMGFGFVEIGTVTPLSQEGNPKPRVFRIPLEEALVNRYGFNNVGMYKVKENLRQYYHQKQQKEEEESLSSTDTTTQWWQGISQFYSTFVASAAAPNTTTALGIVGVNIGKNKESTAQDFVAGIHYLADVADYLVVNISSPNTPGLRDLQNPHEGLPQLLQETVQAATARNNTPLLVKLSPDIPNDQLEIIAQLCLQSNVDGIILTNTTTNNTLTKETGGLSGKPLSSKSTECIRIVYAATRGQIPIVGVGGVSSGKDAYDKLRAGASLIQLYTSLVYQGPGVVTRIRQELATIMRRNGERSIQQVIGADHEELTWQRRIQQEQEEEDKEQEQNLDE